MSRARRTDVARACLALCLIVWSPSAHPGQQQPLSAATTLATGSTAHRTGERDWDWWIYLLGSESALRQVRCVSYFLHSSFPNPIQEVCDHGSSKGKGFVLAAHGWGTFTVNLKVTFKDGSVKPLQHDLDFRALAEGWATISGENLDSKLTIPVEAVLPKQGSFTFNFMLARTKEEMLALTLEDIEVHQDGSKLMTPWTFDILVNGQRLLFLQRRQYNDLRKPTVVRPGYGDVATTAIRPQPTMEIRILGYEG